MLVGVGIGRRRRRGHRARWPGPWWPAGADAGVARAARPGRPDRRPPGELGLPRPRPAGGRPGGGGRGPDPPGRAGHPPAEPDQRGPGRHRSRGVRGGGGGGRGGQALGPRPERSGTPGGGDRPARCRPRRHPAPAGPAAGAGRGGPPPVGPGPAVRHDRQRPAGRRGPHPGRAPGRGRRAVGPLQPGGPGQPRRRLPRPHGRRRRSTRRHRPTGRWPSPTTSGTPPSGRSTRPPPCCCCSVETAARLGVPTDRWVFPLVGLESSHAVSLLRRAEPHTWPAMEVLGAAAAERIGRPLAEAEIIEVYSCFPAAVRVQQRALGLDPVDARPPSPGGWPSPAARSTTSCSSRWSAVIAPAAGRARARSAWSRRSAAC